MGNKNLKENTAAILEHGLFLFPLLSWCDGMFASAVTPD